MLQMSEQQLGVRSASAAGALARGVAGATRVADVRGVGGLRRLAACAAARAAITRRARLALSTYCSPPNPYAPSIFLSTFGGSSKQEPRALAATRSPSSRASSKSSQGISRSARMANR